MWGIHVSGRLMFATTGNADCEITRTVGCFNEFGKGRTKNKNLKKYTIRMIL